MTTRESLSDNEALSFEDVQVFENARMAVAALKKTFDSWVTIGRAIKCARRIADERGGRNTFQRLLERQGLSKIVSQKATWTRLIQIMDNLSAVTAWHETLTDKQQIDWAAPTTIFKHCPVFAKPAAERPQPGDPKYKPTLKEANIMLQEENHRLKRRGDIGSLFDLKNDTVEAIADAIVGNTISSRAERIARAILQRVKKAKPAG